MRRNILGSRLDGFIRGNRRRNRVPASLLLLAALVILFSLVTPSRFLTSFDPKTVRLPTPTGTATPLPYPTDVHGGRIVFTCTRKQINQICMINADGTGYRQLTKTDSNKYYPAISPGGESVIFAVNQYEYFDLHKLDLKALIAGQASSEDLTRLTDGIGNAFSPTFSPDGSQIAFVNRVADKPSAIWIMGSQGENPRVLYAPPQDVVGAAWSPDSRTIAFTMAGDTAFANEVFLLDISGTTDAPRQLSHDLSGIGGSIAWAPSQESLLIFAGPVAAREIYVMDAQSGRATQLTFGGNNASATYSPDGQYIVFNSLRNQGQADLYVVRADGHSMRQLTSNPEPDWQPHWGP